MAPQEPEILRERGKSLEEEFFRREDQRLLKRLGELKQAEANREALAKASGITNPAVLDRLLALGVHAETVAALSLVPLVEVAWADGKLDARERQTIVDHLPDAGITAGSPAQALVAAWLERRPERKLLDAWTHLVQAICEQFSPDEAARLQGDLLQRARKVAGASGGLMGIGSKVSGAEAEMLQQLERAFARR
jgi:hypothetical protein